jgi:hypothetical protein
MDHLTLISSVQYLPRTIDPTYLYVVIGIPIDNFTQASTQFPEDGRCLAPLVPASEFEDELGPSEYTARKTPAGAHDINASGAG